MDCDDQDPARHPDSEERCNGVDDDCDGAVDEGAVDATVAWLEDRDGDGFGGAEVRGCFPDPPLDPGFSTQLDCADDRRGVFPGAPERCHEVDDDCDGLVDEGLRCDDTGATRGRVPAGCAGCSSTAGGAGAALGWGLVALWGLAGRLRLRGLARAR